MRVHRQTPADDSASKLEHAKSTLDTQRKKLHHAADALDAMAQTLLALKTAAEAAVKPHQKSEQLRNAISAADTTLAAHYGSTNTKDEDS